MENENEGPAPLTIKQQTKIFGAPPTSQKGDEKKPKMTKSGIPTKKAVKASKTPSLVVCSADTRPTPFEKQRLSLSKQNKVNEHVFENSDNEDDEEINVITTTSAIKHKQQAEKTKKFQPKSTKKPEIVEDFEDENEEEAVEEKPLESAFNNHSHEEKEVNKSVKIMVDEQPEEEEKKEPIKEEIHVEEPKEEENVTATPTTGERKKRRRKHHRSQAKEEKIETPEDEEPIKAEEVTDQEQSEQFEQPEEVQEVKEEAVEEEEQKEESVPSTPRADGKKNGPDDEEDEKEGVEYLFDNLLEEMKGSANSAVQKLAKWQQTLLDQLVPIEEQQLQRWYLHTIAYLEQQKISYDQNKIEFFENLAELVDVLMIKHRLPAFGNTLHRMRIVITGPRSSGKSTLLAIAASRAIIELAASGEWKKTFIFAYDFASNVHTIKALDELYKNIVKATFTGLAAQRPLVAEYAAALSRCFCDIIEGTPLLPKGFTISNDFRQLVPQLQQLIALITECWAEEDKGPFIVNALAFPIQIAKIFGFDRQIVFADHFDAFLIDSTTDDIFIMENVKNLLDQSSFIAAVQDQEKAAEILKPCQSDGIDLTQSIFRLSTLDIVEDEKYGDREFALQIQDEAKRLNINAGFFGGCPGFLKLWYELNELADEIEEGEQEDEDDDEKIEELEEKQILLANKAGEIINALSEGSNDFVVTAVSKVHKK